MYSNWMEKNYAKLKDMRINRIFLPTTHNSGSTEINFRENYSYNKWIKIGNQLGSILPNYYDNIFRNWTINQKKTIQQQLDLGIRNFVLKISYNKTTNVLYLSHTFVNQPLENAFYTFFNFLRKYPKEIIVMQIVNDWEYRHITNDILLELLIWNHFNKYLYPVQTKLPLLKDMIESNRRIIYIHQNKTYDSDYRWGNYHLNFPWDDASNVSSKIKKLNSTLSQMNTDDYTFNILTFQLTPTTKQVKHNVLKQIFFIQNGDGLHKMASDVEKVLPQFLVDNAVDFIKLSGISFDFLNDTMTSLLIDYFIENIG